MGYPSVKLFIKNQVMEYTGERKAPSLSSWVIKKIGLPVSTLGTLENLEGAIDSKDVLAVFFGKKDRTEYRIIEFASKTYDSVEFALTTNAEALKKYEVTIPALILFKKFDQRVVKFTGRFTKQELFMFIDKQHRPLLMPFNSNAIRHIFEKKNNALIVFRSQEDSSKYDGFLTQMAKDFQNELAFTYIDLSENSKIGRFFGINSMPSVIISQPLNQAKYRLNGEVTEENVKQFIKDWKGKKVNQYLRSEHVVESNEGARKLVGSNFKEVAFDKTKDVLVQFYAPWCVHCNDFAEEYDNLADLFKEVNSVVIAKLDYYANDILGQAVKGFPTFRFFTSTNKKGIDYEGERSFEGLKDFVIQNADINSNRHNGDL